MSLSVICILVDLLSVTPVIPIGYINPFWKFAFVFKCFTDSIILSDFKAALDQLSRHRMSQILPFNILRDTESAGGSDVSQEERKWRKKYGGKPDTESATEIDPAYRQTGMKLSDVGGLCPPSPVRVHHAENRVPRG